MLIPARSVDVTPSISANDRRLAVSHVVLCVHSACTGCRPARRCTRVAHTGSEWRLELSPVRSCSWLRQTFTLDSSLGFRRCAQLHPDAGAVPCIHLRVYTAQSSSACGGRHAAVFRGEPTVGPSDGADPGAPRTHSPPARSLAEHRAAGSAGGPANPALRPHDALIACTDGRDACGADRSLGRRA